MTEALLRRMERLVTGSIVCTIGATASMAQPDAFDLGNLTDGTMLSHSVTLSPGEVEWLRFTIPTIGGSAGTWLDIDTTGGTIPGGNSMLGLYTDAGSLVRFDDDEGVGLHGSLTFGPSWPLRPAIGNGVARDGRDGQFLYPGQYYLAITASGGTQFGGTNWNVVTNHVRSGIVRCHIDVNHNLVFNGHFEFANTGFATEYLLYGDGFPGCYDIRAYPEAWNPLLAPCRSHTAGGPLLMTVDGLGGPLVWAQDVHLPSHSAYLFSFHIVNLYEESPPIILRRINHVDQLPLVHVPISTDACQWWTPEELTGQRNVWISGTAKEMTLALYDVEHDDDAGNDFGLDDISVVRMPCVGTESTIPSRAARRVGESVAFSVAAWGAAGIEYHWRHNGVALTDGPSGNGSILSGTRSATLLIDGISLGDQGTYDAVVWVNDCGSVDSDPARLLIAR